MNPNPPQDRPPQDRPSRPSKIGRGHAPGPEGEPLCGATPGELRFTDPPTCSQCRSVISLEEGRVKKKKNRVKGKHAKGKDGKPLCGVEAKKVHYAKDPSCVNCQAALASKAPKPEQAPPTSRAAAKRRAKKAKTAAWVFVTCPACEASVPEHRLDRHMKKIHSATGRAPEE